MNQFEKNENIALLSETISLLLADENTKAQQNLEYVAHSLRKQDKIKENQPFSPDFEKNLDNMISALAKSIGATVHKVNLKEE